MRLVLDTSVLVAALRSAHGASRVLLSAALNAEFELLISTGLVLEYEAVLTRPEHLSASGLHTDEVGGLLDLLCSVGSEVRKNWNWRPQLTDPNDEMVLETAINGHADAIVTYNLAHFIRACARFGLSAFSPQEALRRLHKA